MKFAEAREVVAQCAVQHLAGEDVSLMQEALHACIDMDQLVLCLEHFGFDEPRDFILGCIIDYE
jgi:hypothetical protein